MAAPDPRRQALEEELSSCVMGASWFWCVAGVALAIPLGVRKKSYMPVVYLGLAGTLADLMAGFDKCKPQRQALERYLQAAEAFGPQATSGQAWAQRQRQQREEMEAAAAAAAAQERQR